MKKILKQIKEQGKIVSTRGNKVLEIENYGFELEPYERFMNFPSRKLSLKYIKNEFIWYLRGDKYDTSICDHASIWKNIIQKDGSIFSNYGQYIFTDSKYIKILSILLRDKNARHANIVILQPYHYDNLNSPEVPCTLGLSFRIRDNKLNMTVVMRSCDAIYGMGNDVPAFSFIQEIICVLLKEKYPELKLGKYYHFVESFHIYEKHWDMLDTILGEEIEEIECPKISSVAEVKYMINELPFHYEKIDDNFNFVKWLRV